jgi:hypothetical protein
MALLQLIARLGLDTSGFSSGLRGAERQAAASSRTIGGSFKSAFGAGLGIGSVMALSSSIGRRIRDLDQLQKTSEKFGITLDASVIRSIEELQGKMGYAKVRIDSGLVKPLNFVVDTAYQAVDGLKLVFYTLTKGAKEAERIVGEATTKRIEGIYGRGSGMGEPGEGLEGLEPSDLMRIRSEMLHRIKGKAMTGQLGNVSSYQIDRIGAIDQLLSKRGISPVTQRQDEIFLRTLQAIEANTKKTAEQKPFVPTDMGVTIY